MTLAGCARVLGLGFAAIAFLSLLSATNLIAQAPKNFALSSGCGSKPAATGVLTLSTTDGNHTPRKYLLQVPADYDPQRGYALIFVFHGSGGSAEGSRALGLQNVKGASQRGIFVFPQGIHLQKEPIGWDDTNRGYDMPFFDNMISNIESSFCIDTSQVFVSGFSWGGDFSIALACNRGDTIRAIEANSTDDEFEDNKNYLTFRNLPCPSHLHPAVRFEHAVGGDAAYPPPDFATTSQLLQYLGQCSGEVEPTASSTSVKSCVSHNGCARRYIECSFDPSIGHALPPNWAQDTWDFFSSFAPAVLAPEPGPADAVRK